MGAMKTPLSALFLIWFLMVVLILVAVRAAQEHAEQHRQPGACVVHACEECAKHADARILMVRYNECVLGHAYCVYTENGQLFAWDWRGAVAMDSIPDYANDAVSVAMWLTIIDPPIETPPLTVRSAAYEWSNK
jgi:hypothetical protein